MKNLSQTRQTGIKLLYKAFEILKRNDNELSGREVMNQIEKEVDLTDFEKERYEKTGYIRWQSILHFYTIDAIKSGFLQKKNAVWYLTEDGIKAMKLGPEELFKNANEGYKKWKSSQSKKFSEDELDTNSLETDQLVQSQKATLEQLEEQAISSIEEYIRALNPYEFQDVVAALLRGMGYFTPFIAPKGKRCVIS